MSGAFEVIAPGLLTTIQDRGRWGWQDHGVPVAGPMDPWAFRRALALVGNAEDAAAIEFTLTGPVLRFDGDTRVAVSGGAWEIQLDPPSGGTRSLTMDHAHECPRGSTLRIGACRAGARGYLACAGGIDTPQVLGSRATDLSSGLGGLGGRALRAGDRVPIGSHAVSAATPPVRKDETQATTTRVRVLPGPQFVDFSASARAAFVQEPYVVGADSNRMGYRLNGPPLSVVSNADIISEAVTFGTIQVPPSGQPIVLMADRQTTGGYPKLGTVIAADLGVLGQLAPGAPVEFTWCSWQEAISALLARERAFLQARG